MAVLMKTWQKDGFQISKFCLFLSLISVCVEGLYNVFVTVIHSTRSSIWMLLSVVSLILCYIQT